MEATTKNGTWYWVVGTIVVLGVLYFLFKDKIDRWLGIAKDAATGGGNYSCASTFYAKLSDGKIQNVWTTDEGTPNSPNVKYYKQDVTLTDDGVTNSGNPIVITKDEFIGMCKYKYNPPYAWYTAAPPVNAGHSGRTFQQGGMAGNSSSIASRNVTSTVRAMGGLYNSNGSPINIGNQKQKSCGDLCSDAGATGWSLEQYPKSSQFYPHYACQCKYNTV